MGLAVVGLLALVFANLSSLQERPNQLVDVRRQLTDVEAAVAGMQVQLTGLSMGDELSQKISAQITQKISEENSKLIIKLSDEITQRLRRQLKSKSPAEENDGPAATSVRPPLPLRPSAATRTAAKTKNAAAAFATADSNTTKYVTSARLMDAFKWEMGSVNSPGFAFVISALRDAQTKAGPGARIVYLDVGTNIGVFPWKVCSDLPAVEVHGFEPVRQYFEFALSKAAPVCGDRTKINHAAASDTDGTSVIMVNNNNKNVGWNSMVEEKTAEQKANMVPETIVTMRLANYLKAAGVQRVHAMKIDTEGFEASVVRGLESFFVECGPKQLPVILMEVGWGTAMGTRKDYLKEREMFKTLQRVGYNLPTGWDQIRGTVDVFIFPASHGTPSRIL